MVQLIVSGTHNNIFSSPFTEIIDVLKTLPLILKVNFNSEARCIWDISIPFKKSSSLELRSYSPSKPRCIACNLGIFHTNKLYFSPHSSINSISWVLSSRIITDSVLCDHWLFLSARRNLWWHSSNITVIIQTSFIFNCITDIWTFSITLA